MKDFDLRKSVHVKLMTETHAAFRILSFKKKLSMQEMFEEFAQRASEEDATALKIINELTEKKKQGKIKDLTKLESDSLLDLIEEESPLGGV